MDETATNQSQSGSYVQAPTHDAEAYEVQSKVFQQYPPITVDTEYQ
jgi:hypothetical protein